MGEGPPFGQVERAGRFPLAARHRLDARPVAFRGVGAVLDAEGERPGQEGRQDDAELRQDVVEEEELHEQRRVPQELDHENREIAHDAQP